MMSTKNGKDDEIYQNLAKQIPLKVSAVEGDEKIFCLPLGSKYVLGVKGPGKFPATQAQPVNCCWEDLGAL